MKIVSSMPSRDTGIISCMQYVMGDDFIVWQQNKKPIFDMIDECKPDIFICFEENVSYSMVQMLREFKNITFVLFGNGIPQILVNRKIDLLIPSTDVSPSVRNNISNADGKILFMKEYANIAQVFGGRDNDKMRCDMSYLSTVPLNMYPKMMKIALTPINARFRYLVYGPHRIKIIPNYVGSTSLEETSSMIKSSKINLNIGGFNLLDIAANKGFAITNINNKLYPTYSSCQDVIKVAEHHLGQPQLMKQIAKKAYKNVMKADTCFHRTADIFDALNLPEMAKATLTKLGKAK